jgi:CrcB protein
VTALLVAAGAALGAPTRFLVDRWARHHHRSGTILGTLVVNVVGSFVLGVVVAVSREPGAPSWLLPLVGVGFCGALTTFSTLAFETWVFLEERAWRPFVANLGLSLVLGGLAAVVGYAAGAGLS